MKHFQLVFSFLPSLTKDAWLQFQSWNKNGSSKKFIEHHVYDPVDDGRLFRKYFEIDVKYNS